MLAAQFHGLLHVVAAGEKVTEILHGLVQSSADDEEDGEALAKWQPHELISKGKATGRGGLDHTKKVRRDAIKTKIRAIGRISAAFKTLREHQEQVVRLKSLVPNARMPVGTLLGGIRGIETGGCLAHPRKPALPFLKIAMQLTQECALSSGSNWLV